LHLPHDVDPVQMRQLVLDIFKGVPGFVQNPGPVVVFGNLTHHSVEMEGNFWVDTLKNNPADAKDDVLLKLKSALAQKGIVLSPAGQVGLI
jgi:small-conductance mechanosensitive channel